MKKLFTLLALLTCFIGAKAEVVVDLEVDYSTYDSDVWNGGYTQKPESAVLEIIPGVGIHVDNPEETADFWGIQFQLPGVPKASFDSDTEYTVTFKIKGSVEGEIGVGFSGSGNTMINVTTSEQEIVLTGQKDVPDAAYWAKSGALMVQSGHYVGEYWITYVKIEHEQSAVEKPTPWKPNMLVNGDAESDWEDSSIDPLDAENNYKVCAWGKEYEEGAQPHPATIEEEEGNPSNHVFVVHSTATMANPWDNQFWIMTPKKFNSGDLVKISLRYKASTNINASIQGHDFPSKYLNNFNMGLSGGMNFTTEWQTYEAECEWEGGWSIVWNLNSSSNTEAVDFYFDDITLQEVDAEEGCFAVAKGENSEYDYSAPIEFEETEEAGVYMGTLGTSSAWVNEIMISTKNGNKKIFQSGTIKPAKALDASNVETWMGYTDVGNYKYQLPAGVWQIEVDTNPEDDGGHMIRFTQIEGVSLAQPVDIVTNASEIVIEGVERDDLKDGQNAQTGEITVKEEQDDPEGLTVGGEGHEGQTWDNQFWIFANRPLAKGEVTHLYFEYKATIPAKTTTQCHGDAGAYLHWGAIGDVNFDTEWQEFDADFTVANEADGMKSIAFNMAEIKDANTYEIKNVKWYVKDEELEAEGQTIENLIKEEGKENFWAKIGGGTSPFNMGGKAEDLDGSGKVDVTDLSMVIDYIWAEDLKGDVNKDGKVDVTDLSLVIEAIWAED